MMKEKKTGVFDYNGESYNFEFKTRLSVYEKMHFVKAVVGILVNDGGYDSIIRDLIFDFIIIDRFTNIDTSFIHIKDDDGNDISQIIPIEHFLEETNVVDIVKENMEYGLIDELNHAVDLSIQYITGINPNPLNESVAKLLSTIEKKISEFDLDNMMEVAQKFNSMTDGFTIENLVKAYMDSDTHKNNLVDIEGSKNK